MQTPCNGLEWEIQWIQKNVDQYDSILHSESVIQNIKKRYLIKSLIDKIKELENEM